MDIAARLSLAITILIVAATVHVVSRAGDDKHLFLMALGRARTSADLARAARVRLVNAIVCGLGVVLALTSSHGLIQILCASVLPLLPIGFLLFESVRLARSLPPPSAPARWLVPLDEPPPARAYVSAPLLVANLAVVLLGIGAFAAVRQYLPDRVPLQFDGRGGVSRWGSPDELWLFAGIELFDLALLALIVFSVARERWALPANDPERYASLQRERRRLVMRLVETLMLGLNGSMTLLWIAIAVGSLPGYGGFLPWAVVTSVALMGVAIVLPLVLFVRPLARTQAEIARLAGSDALGTRADGWRWAGMIYYAPEDPAVFVPKLRGIGQTLNFARPMAWVFLIGIVVAPLALTALVVAIAR